MSSNADHYEHTYHMAAVQYDTVMFRKQYEHLQYVAKMDLAEAWDDLRQNTQNDFYAAGRALRVWYKVFTNVAP